MTANSCKKESYVQPTLVKLSFLRAYGLAFTKNCTHIIASKIPKEELSVI